MKWWYGPLSEDIANVETYDWILWSLADSNPREYFWIDNNVEQHEVLTMYAMTLLQNAEDHGRR